MSGTNNNDTETIAGLGGDTIGGLGGDDAILGGDGDDTLVGGAGDDTLFGNAGDDRFIVSLGNDTFHGGSRTDTLDFGALAKAVSIDLASTAIQQIFKGSVSLVGDIENVIGTNFGDILSGTSGANRIDGGKGGDTMAGGNGDDTYVVDTMADVIVETAGNGSADQVIASASYALAAGAEIEFLATNDPTGTSAIDLTGNAFAQTITGNAGANVLRDGGGAADTLIGLAGNDTYRVYNSATMIIEDANGGTADRVAAGVDYTLAAGVHVEIMTTNGAAGTSAINLTGNAFAQTITGNAGANILRDGGGAADTLRGLGGNDTYRVYNSATVIFEEANGGTADRVAAGVDYALGAGVHVEIMTTNGAAGTSAIDLTGNAFAQAITGNAGANILRDGPTGGAADTLRGLGGNDTYRVYNSATLVFEDASGGTADRVAAGVDYALGAGVHVEIMTTNGASGTSGIDLTGNAFAQTITGNAGANILDGGGGNDTLTGLGGNDTFVFSTALAANNVDTITDFNVAADTIRLDNRIFTVLTPGALADAAFAANTTGLAGDSSDRIVYETDTGRLFYDADGTGVIAGIHFATISAKLALTSADFEVVGLTSTPTNSAGVLGVGGTPAQNQTLTASVSDADGVPGSVFYQWQQSGNGSTWTNIGGATASTLVLQQAQVDNFVRATASYVDGLGNSESVTGPATASRIADVNDTGAISISGTAAEGLTLTANVSDVDGLPASVSYVWQSSDDGNTWTGLGTSHSLILGSSLVGKRLRVNAVYADLRGNSETLTSTATAPVTPQIDGRVSIFTTQTPGQANATDGPGAEWEYGMRFTSDRTGVVEAIRYYKAAGETGTHVGRIWTATGQEVATVTFTNETESGWQQQSLATPLVIGAGSEYIVSVNANSYFAGTSNGFATAISNGGLTAPAGAGVQNATPGAFPTLVYENENYFRDVVFSPAASVALHDNATIYLSETAGVATITVVRTGSTRGQMTLEYTTNEIDGPGSAQAWTDYTQPTFGGRSNTGQIVFEDGESSKTFAVAIVNDQDGEGDETFSIGIQNPGPGGSLGTPRTVLITIVDDDSPTTISMSNPIITLSEADLTAEITVQRSGNIDAGATVTFATGNGSATAGSDYIATTGVVTFSAGQAIQKISIPIVSNGAAEGDESFTVTLSNPTGAMLGSRATTTVNILDDDVVLGNLVRQTYVSGLSQPTAIDWTPDGRCMVVAQKNGVVRVVDNGKLRSAPLVDLSSQVNIAGDRGLLGIAIHPDFAANPYIYLLHTYDPPETAGRTGLAGPDGAGNRPSRLVRFTVDPTTMVADPASMVVLAGTNSTWAFTSRPDLDSTGTVSIAPSGIVNGTTITAPANLIETGTQDNDPSRAGIQNQNIRDYLAGDSRSHSIGGLAFGPDGMLYLSNGDGTSYNFMDPRAVRVQDIHNLSGKVLRIDPITGAGVAGNPFYDAADPNSNQSKVFYSGVRNAYRFTFDPVTYLPVIGDVGWNRWEEINTGPAGSNFGWPYVEGANPTGGYRDLPQAITFYNNGNRNNPSDQPTVFPILTRNHGAPDNAAAITVGDFYNDDTLIFGDVVNGNIYAATLNASRQVTNVQIFDTGIPYIVDMEKGPDGWLYGADLGTGTIRRWMDLGATGGTLAASS